MLLCWLRTQHHPAHSAQVAPAHSDTLLRHVQARHAVTSPVGERSRAWGIIVPTLHSEKSLIRAALDKSGLVAAAGQVRALHDAALRMGAQERGGEHRGASCLVGVHASCRPAKVSLMSIACHITLQAAHLLVLCLQGCVGLCNLGNTCFANSILQVRRCSQA